MANHHLGQSAGSNRHDLCIACCGLCVTEGIQKSLIDQTAQLKRTGPKEGVYHETPRDWAFLPQRRCYSIAATYCAEAVCAAVMQPCPRPSRA